MKKIWFLLIPLFLVLLFLVFLQFNPNDESVKERIERTESHLKVIDTIPLVEVLEAGEKYHWYRPWNLPYEKILDNLAKENYILSDHEGDRTILFIRLNIDWNVKDASRIKSIIMKTLPFEPEIDEYFSMGWVTPEYEVEIYRGHNRNSVLRFIINKKTDHLK